MAEGGAVAPEPVDEIDALNLPQAAKDWARRHPEVLYDPRTNAAVQMHHYAVLDEGHEEYSPSYFDSLEKKMSFKPMPEASSPQTLEQAFPQETAPIERSGPHFKRGYSAPVNRQLPSSYEQVQSGRRSGGQITLTAAQKEACRISNCDEETYARNLRAGPGNLHRTISGISA
jgi:hypothetical protein